MARYGVLGDIHGNIEALTAALTELGGRGVSDFLCVGDVIGYNADSDECAAILRRRCKTVIAGNHDLIGIHRLGFARCSNRAQYALRRTRRTLGREAAAWLGTLPSREALEDGKLVLVHGGVRDVQQYMKRTEHIRENARYLREDFPGAKVCFFGHSHHQLAFEVARGGLVRPLPCEKTIRLRREVLHFVNPGSVDAQRKREHGIAECAIFDSTEWSLEFLAVRYDADSTEAKAVAAGYRIDRFSDRWYTLRRRLGRLAPFRNHRDAGIA